jgi:hypothetical protein
MRNVAMRFEFKIQDSWVGVFWKRSLDEEVEVADTQREAVLVTAPRLDVWLCLVPWFPLHIVFRGCESRSEAMSYIADRHRDDIEKHGWEECAIRQADEEP